MQYALQMKYVLQAGCSQKAKSADFHTPAKHVCQCRIFRRVKHRNALQ